MEIKIVFQSQPGFGKGSFIVIKSIYHDEQSILGNGMGNVVHTAS